MTDCCIIGGGIIGLSIARELAGRGLSVRVLTRDRQRSTASWAAAGIFPPTRQGQGCSAGDILTHYSDTLHQHWARELREETGIDNGLHACGGLHLGWDLRAMDRLHEESLEWLRKGARCELLDAKGVVACEQSLAFAVSQGTIVGGYLLPDEMQLRPPRHLEALLQSCYLRGVKIDYDVEVDRFAIQEDRIDGVLIKSASANSLSTAGASSNSETVRAAFYCLAAGAWSGHLAESLGLTIQTRPIRGQILLLGLSKQILTRIVNMGLEYLVPRTDGRLLVGSTIEDAGFDTTTTQPAIGRLMSFANSLLGELPGATLEQAWAGLRPGSADGLPYMGRSPAYRNAFVSAGHFRAGLHQSTGSAVLLADLITGQQPFIDPIPFEPSRVITAEIAMPSMPTMPSPTMPSMSSATPRDAIDA